jgi:fructokinase
VTLAEDGSASYEFVIDNTATFDFNKAWLPSLSEVEPPALLHVGTLATVIEPGASVLFSWAQDVRSYKVPIIYDPNVRPAVMSNKNAYVEAVEQWASISSVVKVSEEDVQWLFPRTRVDAVAMKWMTNYGTKIVIITRGAKGMVGFTCKGLVVSVPAENVDIVDTVGAGDTVGAVLSEAVLEFGLSVLTKNEAVLEKVLRRAAEAAAVTCSRAGCKPPTRVELASSFYIN